MHPKDRESISPFDKVDRSLKHAIGLGLYRTVLLFGVLAQFWLAAKYVSKSEFEKTKEDISDIKITLRLQAVQMVTLSDHEARLRVLEQRPH